MLGSFKRRVKVTRRTVVRVVTAPARDQGAALRKELQYVAGVVRTIKEIRRDDRCYSASGTNLWLRSTTLWTWYMGVGFSPGNDERS